MIIGFHFRIKGKENKIVRDYVLPDYTNIKRGYIKVSTVQDDSQVNDLAHRAVTSLVMV